MKENEMEEKERSKWVKLGKEIKARENSARNQN